MEYLISVIFVLITHQHVVKGQLPLRLCVPEIQAVECIEMRQAVGQAKLQCVFARDRLHCMEKVQRSQADLVNVDADDVYLAGKEYNLVALVMEEINRSEFLYHTVAVVKKTSSIRSLRDLRMKNSCHTGMGRTAGWNIPIGMLLDMDIISPDCRGENYSVDRFFNSSCSPGLWSGSPLVDANLKKETPSLCALCDDPLRCSSEDAYAGYTGALRCLTEGKGDVAFTKAEILQEFLNRNSREHNNLDYLCLDGTRQAVGDGKPCSWATRPTNVFMGAQNKVDHQIIYHRTLSQIFRNHKSRKPSWLEEVLVSSTSITELLAVPTSRQHWQDYLGNYLKAIERDLPNCEKKTLNFCVTSDLELRKCEDLSKAAYARRLRPRLVCTLESSIESCIESVSRRKADVVTLDGGDIYRSGRDHNLRPLASEMYGDSEASYYAVAVVKDQSKFNELSDLKGKRSCHPAIGQTAGWEIPVAMLVEDGLLPSKQCNKLASLAEFFSSACVPGANNTRFNKNETIANILCKQCAGDESGKHNCSRGTSERYSGESGAFRCLAENRGDVAFLRQSTPIDYTDSKSRQHWTAGLRSMDYKLLCRHGGTASIKEYETCHLARVPAHHVMISAKASEEVQMDAAEFLTDVAEVFGPKTKTNSFLLFGPYHLVSDLLFKDKTTDLQVVAWNATYDSVLGINFKQAMNKKEPENCQPTSDCSRHKLSTILSVFLTALIFTIGYQL